MFESFHTVEVGEDKNSHNCYKDHAHRQADSSFDNQSYSEDVHSTHNNMIVVTDSVNYVDNGHTRSSDYKELVN